MAQWWLWYDADLSALHATINNPQPQETPMTETTEPTYTPCDVDGPPITLEDTERTPCEVYTRVMGYHRPVGCFNTGKQQEHRERVYFNNAKADTGANEE